jgi:hypothetical protein
MRAAVFPVIFLLVLIAVPGCGRKAKPEPLHGESPFQIIVDEVSRCTIST